MPRPQSRSAAICRSLLCLFFVLKDKGAALSTLLARCVFPALVRTLSVASSDVFVHPLTGASPRRECACVWVWVSVCLALAPDFIALRRRPAGEPIPV